MVGRGPLRYWRCREPLSDYDPQDDDSGAGHGLFRQAVSAAPPGDCRDRRRALFKRRCGNGARRLSPAVGQFPSDPVAAIALRSEEHTSELQSLMRISYAFFCLKKKKK